MVTRNRSELRTDAGTPEVILDFDYQDGLLFIVVENIGSEPAYGVSVKFDKKITGVGGEKVISSLKVFQVLEFLPPAKKIRVFVDSLESYVARGEPLIVQATIVYRDQENKSYSNRIKHDISAYEGITEA